MNDQPTVQHVLESEDRRFRALVENDLGTLDGLLADDLRYVHSNGVVEDKAEFIRKLAAGERRYVACEAIRRETRQEGGFTFVFGETSTELGRSAGNLKTRMVYTAVYRNAPQPRLAVWHSVKSQGG